MNRIGQLVGCVTRRRDAEEGEKIWILLAGEAVESGGNRGQLLVADERAIEARGAAFGQQHLDGVECRRVGIGRGRAVVSLEVNRLRLFAQDHGALGRLLRLDRPQRIGRGPLHQPAEVLVDDRHHFGRLHVAHDGHDHVGRDVVLLVERHCIGSRKALQVGRPADDRLPIRVRGEGRGQRLLDQASDRVALGAHAPLFVNDVTLFVELAEHRMEEALGVEIGPQFNTVRRHRVEVARLVGIRESVHAAGAGAIDDLAELIRHDELLCLVDGGLPPFFELSDLCRVVVDGIAAGSIVGGVAPFDFGQRGRLRRVIRRADFVGALEGHVLEHMREAGDPRDFLC